jgi:opacity protein-like surface antigen
MGAALMLVPALAKAQPVGGQTAAGGDFGLSLPAEDELEVGTIWGGFIEGYIQDRFSVRGGIFFSSTEYEQDDEQHEQQIRLGADWIYNWEGGRWHPFAGGGLAIHFVQPQEEGEDTGDLESRVGLNVLGGTEYFINSAWTVKGEVRYQWIEDERNVNLDGLVLTLGLKRYF